MSRVLLVTNDFPPRIGGIQSYLRDFLSCLDPADIVVFASTQDAAAASEHDALAPYRIIRWQRSVMLPTPGTIRRMQSIIRDNGIDTVWFGAAAPLAVMAHAARKAGARRVIATTHGHEVGWSMVPGARQILGIIGRNVDVVTYISDYTLSRIRGAIGETPRYERLPSGVDTDLFHPLDETERANTRAAHGISEDQPLIVCVSRLVPRKGQDSLIRALPRIQLSHPDAVLVLVGEGGYEKKLRQLRDDHELSTKDVIFTGRLEFSDMVSLLASADIAAVPARTRGKGLDVEGLGIVFLEAQACAVPVVAGDSGGAPETVTEDTGIVVSGRDTGAVAHAVTTLLDDPQIRAAMGAAGRDNVVEQWSWETMGAKLRRILGVEGESR